MQKRYQVFVSSTYLDLVEERHEVIQSLLELECIPAGMELFPAANETQWNLIKGVIDECDYYIVIIAGRYGSKDRDGISYTEKEYAYAKSVGKPILAFLHSSPQDIPSRNTESTLALRRRLSEFRKRVRSDRPCKEWTNKDKLGSEVKSSLVALIKSTPAIGWVRGNSADLASTTKEFEQFKKDNAALQKRLNDLDRAKVDKINADFVTNKNPGPIAIAVFPNRSRDDKLKVQEEKIVPFLNQLNRLAESWGDRFEYGVLSDENWEQRLTWYRDSVWKYWIKPDQELSAINDHVIKVRDFQNKGFGDFYTETVGRWKRGTETASDKSNSIQSVLLDQVMSLEDSSPAKRKMLIDLRGIADETTLPQPRPERYGYLIGGLMEASISLDPTNEAIMESISKLQILLLGE